MVEDQHDKEQKLHSDAGAGVPLEEKQVVLARDVLPETLPILPVANRPLFPKMVLPLILDDEKAKKVIADLINGASRATKASSKFVGIVLIRPRKDQPDAESVQAKDLYSVGVAAEILRVHQSAPEAPIQLMVGVLERFAIEKILVEEPTILAKVRYLCETEMSVNEVLHLIFPKENKRDFDELPAHIRKGLDPHFVGTFQEVVEICF